MAGLFAALGPCYIKLGQILGTRRDLFSEPFISELERLQDRLAPNRFEVVPHLFWEEFGVSLQEVFSEFDTSPVASASVASVYRARLKNGREVAVKVRRPGIAQLISTDLRLLRLIGGLLKYWPSLRLIPFTAVINEFGSCVERQLDFRREAAANKRLRSALAWEPNVVIPELIEELCGASVLTMDFIREFHASSHVSPEMARKALIAALRALYRMIFVEGFIHCDLHSGNLHLLPDGRAALIDFGFMAEFPRADRLIFAEFFFAMTTNDGARCAELTIQAAVSTPSQLCYSSFESEVVALVNRASGTKARQFQVANFVISLFAIQRRFHIVGTTASVMAIISLLVLEGISKTIHSELDFQQEALPYIFRGSVRPYIPAALRSTRPDFTAAHPAEIGVADIALRNRSPSVAFELDAS